MELSLLAFVWITTSLQHTPGPIPAPEPAPSPSLVWFDLEGDGDQDALAIEADGTLRLLRSDGERGLEDVTDLLGLGEVGSVLCALPANPDSRGMTSLVLGGSFGLRVFRMTDGMFEETTDRAGLPALGVVRAADWVDANGDGLSDLHLVAQAGHRVLVADGGERFRELEVDLPVPAVVEGGRARLDGSERPERPPGLVGGTGAGTGAEGSGIPPSDRVGRTAQGPGAGVPVALGPGFSATAAPPAQNILGCVNSLADQAGGACLVASSEPTLGMLFPYPGENNSFTAPAVVGGGENNAASQTWATVGGGYDNTASGYAATVGGGSDNTASQTWATVGGGGFNAASRVAATVGGGYANTASGSQATVPGGLDNRAEGICSFAAGRSAQALQDSAFVWSGSASPFSSTAERQFLIDASGGVGINTNAPAGALHVLQPDLGNGLFVQLTDPSTANAAITAGHSGPGTGVSSNMSATSGGTIGVLGSVSSPDGIGGLFSNSVGGLAGQFVGEVEAQGTVSSKGATGGSFVAFNPNNENASVNLSWLNDVARIRIGGNGAGALGGLDIQRTGNTSLLRILDDGKVGIGDSTPSERLDVAGNVRCVSLIQTSDARYKRDVKNLERALETVLALRGVSYEWDPETFPQGGEGRALGFLAQEVREVVPEAVHEDADGYLSVSYSAIVPVLSEAIAAQQEAIAAQAAALGEQGRAIAALRTELDELRASLR